MTSWSNEIAPTPDQASSPPLMNGFFAIWPNDKLIKWHSTYTFKQADIASLKGHLSLDHLAIWSNNTAPTRNQASSYPLWVFVSWQNDKLIKWDSTNTQSSMLPSPREGILCLLTKWHSHSLNCQLEKWKVDQMLLRLHPTLALKKIIVVRQKGKWIQWRGAKEKDNFNLIFKDLSWCRCSKKRPGPNATKLFTAVFYECS